MTAITKCDKDLLQSVTGITKCDKYYKVRQHKGCKIAYIKLKTKQHALRIPACEADVMTIILHQTPDIFLNQDAK